MTHPHNAIKFQKQCWRHCMLEVPEKHNICVITEFSQCKSSTFSNAMKLLEDVWRSLASTHTHPSLLLFLWATNDSLCMCAFTRHLHGLQWWVALHGHEQYWLQWIFIQVLLCSTHAPAAGWCICMNRWCVCGAYGMSCSWAHTDCSCMVIGPHPAEQLSNCCLKVVHVHIMCVHSSLHVTVGAALPHTTHGYIVCVYCIMYHACMAK